MITVSTTASLVLSLCISTLLQTTHSFPTINNIIVPTTTKQIPKSSMLKLHPNNNNSNNKDETTKPTTTTSTNTIPQDRTVTILTRGPNHIVALKPPSVVCHHSGWTGSRSKAKRGEEPEIPMLQRVRDAIHDIDSRLDTTTGKKRRRRRKVNLVHRLDRGASGALLLAYADNDTDTETEEEEDVFVDGISTTNNTIPSTPKNGSTASLIEALASSDATKTYLALVRGEGIFRGDDYTQKGWFEISRPIKDESGKGEAKDATTSFYFVAGQAESVDVSTGVERPRMSLVLARPKQGRWHQIRRHLNGISHPILGDTTHGASTVNREWKEKRNLPGERICLHMARMQLPPSTAIPEGLDIACPLLDDMLDMLKVYAPDVLQRSLPVLEREGILVEMLPSSGNNEYEVGAYTIPEKLLDTTVEAAADDSGPVEILEQGDHYVIVSKPPSVVVHHSSWTGKRSDPKRRWKEATPMLQRVRDATGRRVNLVHRLDRGASGCLVFAFAQNTTNDAGETMPCGITKTLIESMQMPEATKTYIALCDGDGTWNGVDYLQKGWFNLGTPVKDEWGKLIDDCSTDIRFIAGKVLPPIDDGEDDKEGRKICIVLTRPSTGRWHQVRQHLSSGTIGHAILGDSSHGRSRTNRIWKKKRHLLKERTCLHLARVQLPPTEYTPNGVDVSCPLPKDMMKMLYDMPDLLEEARPLLLEEGINI